MLIRNSGFSYEFDSSKCDKCGGKCCVGESGYIWIDKDEIELLRKELELDFDEFSKKYLFKVGYRYSIKEKPYEDGVACLFFDEESKNCSIYKFRPKQCRTFPFWDYFKKNFNELERECIGVKSI